MRKPKIEMIASGFSEEEIQGLSIVYATGETGSLIVGMRGDCRVITTMLPHEDTLAKSVKQLSDEAHRLKTSGCDGWLYARVMALKSKGVGTYLAMLADSSIKIETRRYRAQTLILLELPTWQNMQMHVDDDFTQVLEEILEQD